jgi:predicted enzyme related to lactoylglutathione lyase
MVHVQSVMFNIFAKHFDQSVAFYRGLIDADVVSQTEWRVVLSPRGQPGTQIAIMAEASEFTPRQAWGMPAGSMMTLVVDDLYDALDRALELGATIIAEPAEIGNGMTRAVIHDPSRFVIDLSTPTELLERRPPNPQRAENESVQQPLGRGYDPAGQA